MHLVLEWRSRALVFRKSHGSFPFVQLLFRLLSFFKPGTVVLAALNVVRFATGFFKFFSWFNLLTAVLVSVQGNFRLNPPFCPSSTISITAPVASSSSSSFLFANGKAAQQLNAQICHRIFLEWHVPSFVHQYNTTFIFSFFLHSWWRGFH